MNGFSVIGIFPFQCARDTLNNNVGNGRFIGRFGKDVDSLELVKASLIPDDWRRVVRSLGGRRDKTSLFLECKF